MKKNITILLVSFSAILILDTLNAGQALVMLLLAGIIPGTNVAINASLMFEYILFLTGFILARISSYAFRTYSARTQASNGTILSAQS